MKRRESVVHAIMLLLVLIWETERAAEAATVANAARSMLRHRQPTLSKTSPSSFCFVTPYRGLFVQEEPDARRGERGDISRLWLQQHPDFGARLPWSFILDLADDKLRGGEKTNGDDNNNNNNNNETPSPCPNCFLIYAVRHGRAISNAIQEFVGDDTWNSGVGQACDFAGDVPELRGEGRRKEGENASWPLFDAPLSEKGREQASSLGELLNEGGWAQRLIGGDEGDEGDGGGESENEDEDESSRGNALVVASPLSRTLDTALLALGPALLNSSVRFHVSEWARETTGVNTCDARRGVSGETPSSSSSSSSSFSECGGGGEEEGRQRRRRRRHHCSCSYDKGLRQLYASSSSPSSFDGFPVVGRGKEPWSPEKEEGAPLAAPSSSSPPPPPLLGLFSKSDKLWDPMTRESANSVRRRTQVFLELATELASRAKGGGGGGRGGDEEEKSGSGKISTREKKQKKKKGKSRHRRIFVVAHSGWIEQLLIGVGRRGFVPENAELVPLLVQRKEGAECASAAGGFFLEEE